MKNIGYKLDRINNTLTLTRDFKRKANIVGTPEYDTFTIILNQYPTIKITDRTIIDRTPDKKTHKGLTYANMEKYIALITNDNEAKIKELETMRKVSKLQPAPYSYVKSWFVKHYADYKEFDITEMATSNVSQLKPASNQ